MAGAGAAGAAGAAAAAAAIANAIKASGAIGESTPKYLRRYSPETEIDVRSS